MEKIWKEHYKERVSEGTSGSRCRVSWLWQLGALEQLMKKSYRVRRKMWKQMPLALERKGDMRRGEVALHCPMWQTVATCSYLNLDIN